MTRLQPEQPPYPAIPTATYRLQMNSGFNFAKAKAIVPYLARLGISHVYSSPCLTARPGSLHGYDIVDHNAVNPELGGDQGFHDFIETLRRHAMGLIVDVVPNHMGVGHFNSWWIDILENGQASIYDGFFDIDWHPLKEELKGKVLVPVLGEHYGTVLAAGQLALVFDPEYGNFYITYFEHRFPISPRTYPVVLSWEMEWLETELGADSFRLQRFQSLLTAFRNLPDRHQTTEQSKKVRNRDKELYKHSLASLCRKESRIREHIERAVRFFNQIDPDKPEQSALHLLLEMQVYRLAHWRVATDEINYRRFFDINDLIALRMENPLVESATHRLLDELIAAGKIDGVRIDHPDGLSDPEKYLSRFTKVFNSNKSGFGEAAAEPQTPLVYVEKILAPHERLPESWPVQGATGYDFCNQANGLFVAPQAERPLTQTYERFLGEKINFDEQVYQSKKLIMKTSLSSELSVLAKQLNDLSEPDLCRRDFTLNALRDALMEVVACFPVYRTYINQSGPSELDRRHVEWAIGRAKKLSPAGEVTIFDFLREVLLLQYLQKLPEADRPALLAFVMRLQQYTAPVTAKGLEDTAFYLYNRLVSLNEVGGEPSRFGTFLSAFHKANEERCNRYPHTLLATSTHDSKRSEDVRVRINVISEMVEEWRRRLTRWSRLNRAKKRLVDQTWAPERNDEYLYYQTLLGVWPLEELDEAGVDSLQERIVSYMIKAAKEAKERTSWVNPNPEYEQALRHFIQATLDSPRRNAFLADFIPFKNRVAAVGLFNSLSQLVLKLTSPGVPDFYQGCELWNFSLVDPDNRQAVDFELRAGLLEQIEKRFGGLEPGDLAQAARGILADPADPRLKLYVTWRVLRFRLRYKHLFQESAYQSLPAEGPWEAHICAFARIADREFLITVVPRWIWRLCGDQTPPLGSRVWKETRIHVPSGVEHMRNLFTGETVPVHRQGELSTIFASDALSTFPVAVITTIDPFDTL
ncbi:MAG: malto-oligosyltrehalose synthase [Deltaproteobacteria bacterium]|nr:malto-oligosyltrehalose synthase [Deltaproteobacteria bacterium]